MSNEKSGEKPLKTKATIVNGPGADMLLKSFNILDPTTVKKIDQLNLNPSLLKPTRGAISIAAPLNTSSATSDFKFIKQASHVDQATEYSAEVGIKGKYKFYSGSIKLGMEGKQYSNSNSVIRIASGKVIYGDVSYNIKDVDLLQYLDPQITTDLANMKSLQDAADFVNKNGTHVITGWFVGGAYYVSSKQQTMDYGSQIAINAEIDAAYNAAGNSIEGSAKASYELKKNSKNRALSIIASTVGGDPTIQIDISQPAPANNVQKWLDSIKTENKAFGMSNNLAYEDLAKVTGHTGAYQWLTKYTDLKVLENSLKHPIILEQGQPTPGVKGALTTCRLPIPKGFKAVSGGVGFTGNMYDMVTGCYPELDTNNEIAAWNTQSSVPAFPGYPNTLLSYAVVVHDPGDCLKVNVVKKQGVDLDGDRTKHMGVAVSDADVLVGGGCKQLNPDPGPEAIMYMRSSVPDPTHLHPTSKNSYVWYGASQSRGKVTGVHDNIEVFSIGISCSDLNIVQNHVSGPIVTNKADPSNKFLANHVNIGSGYSLIGAGILSGGYKNRVVWSYPVDKDTWRSSSFAYSEFQGDVDSSQIVALYLDVSLKGVASPPSILDKQRNEWMDKFN